ncbi:uncharacterized protein BXZ73DRAFT_92435 [Epithele typhae]|uniref:uncharacterized protein n=1 Tax=Epithele typhae TaxID=378194 RepID=UPI0020082BD4|nr:uncharacterized protein BXZ73DRAFT_92435 [Epithele typhae]KAH9916998.1 hypothetical protein BXZ73DRAFT_92435 [Epithele typhae]
MSDSDQVTGFTSILQSPAGPPLILVCIAGGLFLGAFCGTVIMRRFRPDLIIHRVANDSKRGPGFGDKPKLLDMHLLPAAAPNVRSGKASSSSPASWASLSVSAPPLPRFLRHGPHPTGKGPPPLHPPRPPDRLPRAFSLRKALPRIGRAPRDPEVAATAAENPTVRKVQLAVAHTMMILGTHAIPKTRPALSPASPDSAPPIHDPRSTTTGADEDPMPDCCIGTLVVTYHLDPADVDVPPPPPVPLSDT